MNNRLKELILVMNSHIQGTTTIEELKTYLPINDKNLTIKLENNILIFEHMNKISRLYITNHEVLNIEVLKRVGYAFGVTLKEDELIERTKFSLQMKNLAGGQK